MRLPGFTFSEEIYRGSRSIVHRAVRDEDGEAVVVKTPADRLLADREIRRYRREFETGRLFSADGGAVIGYRGLLTHEHGVFLVVEDFGGISLAQALPREGFDLPTFFDVAVRLADALSTIHRQGVVHRDVQPGNVVVSRDLATLKVIDFSAASQLAQERRRGGRLSELEGTLAYMSPEQTGRMNRVVDERTDVYSLGVTLYQLLTGRLPFTAGDALGLIHCHLARHPQPPHEARPSVPVAVSEIVLRMMAKSAEDRYQSSEGVRADLERCAEALSTSREIRPFRLGAKDRRRGFWIPQRLYGREREIEALTAAFERLERRRIAAEEGAEVLLIAGRSGVGKSALVYEIYKPVTERRGFFVAGKYEQTKRDIPYSGLRQALGALCDQVVSEHAAELDAWRRRILDALGHNAGILTAAIPELERLLGEQPAGPPATPMEEQNRLQLAFSRFFAEVGRAAPLVAFLDDLQWVDPASLRLLETMMKSEDAAPLLLIAAYRDHEIEPSHPLLAAAAELAQAGGSVHTFRLGNLTVDDVTQLVAETLSRPAQEIRPLAERVHEKTRGNAFFVVEFLKSLHREGLLWLSEGQWRWDSQQIGAHDVTENVVELVAGEIERLDPETRLTLRLAACLGNSFDHATLALARGAAARRDPASRAAISRCLWLAVRAGLIFPTDGRALDLLYAEGGEEDLDCRFKFAHDRVQQAAYGSLDEAERQAMHLEIGRRLSSAAGGDPEERLFEAVYQWNRALARLTDPGERVAVASLNLAAGRKAKRSNAYREAASYLRTGAGLLPEEPWSSQYRLWFDLRRELAEAESLAGRFGQADAICESLYARARSDDDRLEVRLVRLAQFLLQGKYAEAVAVGIRTLELFAIAMPEGDDEIRALWASELEALPEHLGGRRVAELVDAPRMTDGASIRLMRFLNLFGVITFIAHRMELCRWATIRRVMLSLRHGNHVTSSLGYVHFGLYVSADVRKDFDEAHAFGELGVELADRFESLALRGRARMVYYSFIHYWKHPLSSVIDPLRENYAICVEGGDFAYASYSIWNLLNAGLASGRPLAEIREEAHRFLPFLRRTRAAIFEGAIRPGFLQPIATLLGETKHSSSFDDEEFSEDEFLRRSESQPYNLAVFYGAKIRSLYELGHLHAGIRLLDKVPLVTKVLVGHPVEAETWFYAAMTLAAVLGREAPGDERAKWAASFDECREAIRRWADRCPANHLHRHLLIEAERLRLAGELGEATALYDRAVTTAREHGYLHHEALANELCGRLWLGRGDRELARVYLRRSRTLYGRWGASAKVADLEDKHRELDLRPGVAARRSEGSAAAVATRHLDLDLGAVLQASQVISGEIRLERLVRRMMGIIIITAGARRGCLVLDRDGELRVEGEVVPAKAPLPVLQGIPVADHSGIPQSVVRHVMGSGEELVLDAAQDHERFGSDPYVRRTRMRSILALPLQTHRKVVGLVYLENELISHAFHAERVEVLRALVAQAAISLENALLYSGLEREVEEHKRTEERLRTYAAELEAKNAELEQFTYTVSHDLKSPLVTIRGFLGLLRRDAEIGDVQRLDHDIASIERAADTMAQLLSNLLDLSRIGRVDGPRASVAVSEVAREAARLLAGPIAAREAEVGIEPAMPEVFGDRMRLSQVWLNLIENAIKFTDEQPRPRVDVGWRHDGDEAVFFVRDNGRGIESPYREKVFGLFEQLDPSREGTGIGLALVRRIVEVHGGRVWVESEGRGQGSSFCFTLPLANPGEALAEAKDGEAGET